MRSAHARDCLACVRRCVPVYIEKLKGRVSDPLILAISAVF